jgi:hypothetical protein
MMVLVGFSFGCGRDGVDQKGKAVDAIIFDRAVKDFVDAASRLASGEITEAQLRAKAAWFKPYYRQLVRVPDPYVWAQIVRRHEPGFALQNLEPLLSVETGRVRKFVAIAMWELSYGLHPRARDALLAMDKDDPDVRRCLFWETSVPVEARETVRHHQRSRDEAARREAGVSVDEWTRLNAAQKWERLSTAWFGRKPVRSKKQPAR